MTTLTLSLKQGEEINVPMTITSNGVAVDLTDATIVVEIKKSPYLNTTPMFSKTITTTSDLETVGQITYPATGVFEIHFSETDTAYPPYDYYLVIWLDMNNEKNIISSYGSYSAIYRICTQ